MHGWHPFQKLRKESRARGYGPAHCAGAAMLDSHAATSCASGSKFRGLAGALHATTGTSSHCIACLSVNALGGQGPLCPLGNGRLRTEWQDGKGWTQGIGADQVIGDLQGHLNEHLPNS